jgi:hypothetical protein
MATITKALELKNGEVLSALLALQSVKATNALASVKLARLRKALALEAEPIAKAFDECGRKYAARLADGSPEVALVEGEPQMWIVTGTPFYVLADRDGFSSENKALSEGSVTVTVPLLTETDLAQMDVAKDVCEALLPFVDGL